MKPTYYRAGRIRFNPDGSVKLEEPDAVPTSTPRCDHKRHYYRAEGAGIVPSPWDARFLACFANCGYAERAP